VTPPAFANSAPIAITLPSSFILMDFPEESPAASPTIFPPF